MKHYAPYINNIIPAFQWNENNIIIKVPFEHHQTIGAYSMVGYALQIKDALQEDDIEPIIIINNYNVNDLAWSTGVAEFTISATTNADNWKKIKIGRYYKISLAYTDAVNDNEYGYWSNVGITKCTKTNIPTLNITNNFRASLAFSYEGEKIDIDEKLYSVQFYLYDDNNVLLENSNEIIVNYQSEANISNTVVEHQFNTYFDNKTFEELLTATTDNPFTNYNDILEKGVELHYVENHVVEEGGNEVPCYLAWDELNNLSYEPLSYNLDDKKSPYYKLCKNIYYDEPEWCSVKAYNLVAIYTTLNKYSDTIYHNNFSVAMSSSDEDFIMEAENDYDNALIQLSFKGATIIGASYDDWATITVSGVPVGHDDFKERLNETCREFSLIRKNLMTQQCIRLFSANSLNSFLDKPGGFQDLGIEQGVEYEYILAYKKIFRKNLHEIDEDGNDVYSFEVYYRDFFVTADIVMADFEDCFLYDAKSQLRLRFNPKVSSYKLNIPQTKQETIGGKFPFIFENRQIRYKEFPINFLISYLQDDTGYFYRGLDDKHKALKDILNKSWHDSELDRYTETMRTYSNSRIDWGRVPKTSVDGNNMYIERQFKMAVLDWLTNGQMKIFKSPAEGNVVVKLINISMSPEDKLSRMLHTLTGTAIEVEEYSDTFLQKNNLLLYNTFSNRAIDTPIPSADVVYHTQTITIDETTGEKFVTYVYNTPQSELTTQLKDSVYRIEGSLLNQAEE